MSSTEGLSSPQDSPFRYFHSGHFSLRDTFPHRSSEAILDPSWKIKKTEWSDVTVDALRFFEEVRVQFVLQELIQGFPVLLEHHLRSELRQRVTASGLRTLRGDFHVQAICRYLEDSEDGLFAIERHLPPDLEEDHALLLQALQRAATGG
jgi:hypothetical protein